MFDILQTSLFVVAPRWAQAGARAQGAVVRALILAGAGALFLLAWMLLYANSTVGGTRPLPTESAKT